MNIRSVWLAVALSVGFIPVTSRADYQPPSYPQIGSALERIAVEAPESARAGDRVSLSATVRMARQVETPRRLFVHFVQDGKVWHVEVFPHESSEGLTPASLSPGRDVGVGPFDVALPSDMPGGSYELITGMYLEDATAAAAMSIQAAGPGPTRIMINTGTFTDKHGVSHRWHVNRAHTLYWNGRPFFPVGGMLIPDHNLDAFKAQIDLLVRNNVRDVYLNVGSSVQIPRTWETKNPDQLRLFQRYVDYMDEKGMRYGLQPSGLQAHGFGFDLMGGTNVDVVVSDEGEPALKDRHDNRWIEDGKLHVAEHRIRDTFYLVTRRETGRVLGYGRAEVVRDERPGPDEQPRGEHDQVVRIALPEEEPGTAYTVHLTVARRLDTWNHNMHFWGEDTKKYFEATEELYSQIRMGPGLRFIVDPFWNENNLDHNFIPQEAEFRARHERWLRGRYERIEALHEAWAFEEPGLVPDFETAAHLLPIRWVDEAATGETWAYLIDMNSGRLVRCPHSASQYLYDLRESIGHQMRDFHNELADLYKTMHDVPIIFKNFSGMDRWHINDAGVPGGFDGLGMESYGLGEPILTFMGISTFGEVRQSTKTMWLLVTELGEGNHQDQAPAQNKLFGVTSRLGTMYPTYASMLSGGAKGIYHYYLMPSPGVQRFWDDASSRDPRQLEWLGTFAHIAENAPGLADYAPTAYYRFPGLFHPNSGLLFSDPYRDYTNTDTLWWVDPAGKLPNGAWLLPTFTLDIESDMVFVNLEDEPATLRFGEEATAHVVSGRRVTWLGYRRDLGTIPVIDRYYTDEFARDDDGVTFQVLDPPAGVKVIGRNRAGKVWNIRHEDLQIISKDARNVTGWRPDRVELPDNEPYDYWTFMEDVLGVERLELGEAFEGFTYLEPNARVTVISLADDRNNVVQLGEMVPPFTQDGTGNALPPASMHPRELVFRTPERAAVLAVYPDHTPIPPSLGGTIRVTLEPDHLNLINSNRQFDWAPEGLLFDTRATRATVILRGPRDSAPMIPENLPEPVADPGEADPSEIVLIEAERPTESNFNLNVYSGLAELSGDGLLGLASASPPPAPDGYTATYEFSVPDGGVYQLWVREGYLAMASPARWRVNDGPWAEAPNTLVPRDIRLAAFYNALEDERMLFAWYHYGQVELTAGTHRLTYSVTEPRPGGLDIGLANNTPYGKLLDCFVLTRHDFRPAGRDLRARRDAAVTAGADPASGGVGSASGRSGPPVNLIHNPSMEQDTGGWEAHERRDGRWQWFELRDDHGWDRNFWWTRRAPGHGRMNLPGLMDIGGLQLRQSFAGVRSLRIRAGEHPRRFTARPVPVSPGEIITFGGYIRTESLNGQQGDGGRSGDGRRGGGDGLPGEADWRVVFLDDQGRPIERETVRTEPVRGTVQWQEVKPVSVAVPEGAASAVLTAHVSPASEGTAWFDDAFLYRGQ